MKAKAAAFPPWTAVPIQTKKCPACGAFFFRSLLPGSSLRGQRAVDYLHAVPCIPTRLSGIGEGTQRTVFHPNPNFPRCGGANALFNLVTGKAAADCAGYGCQRLAVA